MNKIFLYTVILAIGALFTTSCEKDEIGGTATESMAGEWYVKVDAVDSEGNIVYDDPYGMGYFHLDTYNTSSNSTTEMWIDDLTNFWYFKNKVNIDLKSMTFEVDDAANEYYDMTSTIMNGKILYDMATTPSGSVADSIVFEIVFSDDDYTDPNSGSYLFAAYRIAGFRYTGLTNDD